MEIVQANTASLIFSVVPQRALIYINDRLIGSARDFSTEKERYTLVEGIHNLRVEFPGYIPFLSEMQIIPNRTLHLDLELERAAGR